MRGLNGMACFTPTDLMMMALAVGSWQLGSWTNRHCAPVRTHDTYPAFEAAGVASQLEC